MLLEQENVLAVVSAIDKSIDAQSALNVFMCFASGFGFERFFITQVVNPFGPDAGKGMTHSDWPDEIIKSRFEAAQLLHDPVVQFGMRSRFPFAWKDAYEHASRYGRSLMDETKAFKLLEGYSFPMRRPGVPIGGVSLGGEKFAMSPEERAALEIAALHIYTKLESLHAHSLVDHSRPLSVQETDVLQFSALGKSAWEISMVLGITESGVKKALFRAREKLGAVNTVQACASAISKDLILP